MVEPDWRQADPTDVSFRLDTSPFYWLTRVSGRYLMEMSRRLRAIGMDVPRWRVLMILAEHEPASISTLAEQAVINLSTMTKIVQRMEADGLVVATARESDARITEVRLTEAGTNALANVRTEGGKVFRQAFATLDAAEINTLSALLQRVFVNL